MPAKRVDRPRAVTDRAFWDTSAIVPLCFQQTFSAELRSLSRKFGRTATWWGTTVEAVSAFSRLVREGRMTTQGLKHAAARLDLLRATWVEVTPSDRVREIAERLPEQFGLRALDSFQLAAALVWCKEIPKYRTFVCCDLKLSAAAVKAGFDVIP
jgi:predicted nucleic acid-binding protein